MNIVLLGAPGSGKGTQAKPLSARYGVPHISTGDIFRHEMATSSPLGLKVQQYVSSGRLVPDELVLEIVTARLAAADCAPGFILDGFPRTVSQAEGLDAFLNGTDRTCAHHAACSGERAPMYRASEWIAASRWLRVRTAHCRSCSRCSRNARTRSAEMSSTRSRSTSDLA